MIEVSSRQQSQPTTDTLRISHSSHNDNYTMEPQNKTDGAMIQQIHSAAAVCNGVGDTNLGLHDLTFLFDWTIIILSIFGGCCSNMFTLESIVKYETNSGLIITFVQVLVTASVAAWPQRRLSSQFPWILRSPKVPLASWATSAALFWITNMMNNWAFGFNISVPVHIILRSGGSVTTILVGYVWGKRYTRGQIMGVLILTIGVIIAAMADAQAKGKKSSGVTGDRASFVQGLLILFIAQVLSAIMGLYTQSLYAKHGPQWEENLLWSHIFSLMFSAAALPTLQGQYQKLAASRPFRVKLPSIANYETVLEIPEQLIYLALNSMTQFFCIRGVNRLAARSSALGVTIVLNVRKLISLFLSIWLFGNSLPAGVWFGAALVFLGGGFYAGWDSWRKTSKGPKPRPKKE